jgi:hypothetical protein
MASDDSPSDPDALRNIVSIHFKGGYQAFYDVDDDTLEQLTADWRKNGHYGTYRARKVERTVPRERMLCLRFEDVLFIG